MVREVARCLATKKFFIRLANFLSGLVFRKSIYNSLRRVVVTLAVVLFILFMFVLFLHKNGYLSFSWPFAIPYDYFFGIYISFTFILFYEVISLIFVIPQSIAKSIGKQYEIVSLIVLRMSFENIGKYRQFIKELSFDLSSIDYVVLLDFLAGIIGPLVLFFLVRLYYSVQSHARIISDPSEYRGFVAIKQGLSLLLLFVFISIVFVDIIASIYSMLEGGGKDVTFGHSFFKDFFTALVFVDIFLVLITIRYSSSYDIIFRNSGLTISTVLIRLSFSSSSLLVLVLVSWFALCIGLFVSLIYNRFQGR